MNNKIAIDIYNELQSFIGAPNDKIIWEQIDKSLSNILDIEIKNNQLKEYKILCNETTNDKRFVKNEIHVGVMFLEKENASWLFQHLIITDKTVVNTKIEEIKKEVKDEFRENRK